MENLFSQPVKVHLSTSSSHPYVVLRQLCNIRGN